MMRSLVLLAALILPLQGCVVAMGLVEGMVTVIGDSGGPSHNLRDGHDHAEDQPIPLCAEEDPKCEEQEGL